MPKRNNNKKNNKGRKARRYPRRDQISKTLNVHSNNTAVNAQLNHAVTIYQTSNTGNYSFTSTTDVRVETFQAMIAASSFYADFFSTYEEFKVISLTVYITPVRYLQNSLTNSNITGALYIGIDPEFIYSATPANPSNSIVIDSNRVHIVPAVATYTDCVTFTFPGTGQSENIWVDTSLNLNGAFFIGDISTSMSGIVSQPAFDCVFSFAVHFRGMRVH
jgi:hypothetical protein